MRRVFLDTNFLIDLIRFKIGLEEIQVFLQEPIDFFILSSTLKELQTIARNKGKSGNLAKVALEIVKSKGIKILETEQSPDKAFLSLADKNTIIATNDSELRKKLKKLGIKTIYLRAKKYLEVS
ncbi:MAG: PIN domain-containing protein [Candidatus Aenigmatarchaeota archaeon]